MIEDFTISIPLRKFESKEKVTGLVKNGYPYVEAHHLIPMAFQNVFEIRLILPTILYLFVPIAIGKYITLLVILKKTYFKVIFAS